MCTGRRVPRLEKVVKEIENAGGEATYQKVDVSIEKEVSDAVSYHSRVDILVAIIHVKLLYAVFFAGRRLYGKVGPV